MTEHELIKGCIRKDTTCQRMLFETYSGRMMTVCLRYACDHPEAEDILQEAFVRVFTYIAQYKHEGSFEGWIRRIVVTTALKTIQKRKIKFRELTDAGQDASQIQPHALTNLTEAELMKMINELPDGYRLVFNLAVIEGYSHEEIAKLLDIQPGTSRSQLVKARRMLQEQIISLQKIAV